MPRLNCSSFRELGQNRERDNINKNTNKTCNYPNHPHIHTIEAMNAENNTRKEHT